MDTCNNQNSNKCEFNFKGNEGIGGKEKERKKINQKERGKEKGRKYERVTQRFKNIGWKGGGIR